MTGTDETVEITSPEVIYIEPIDYTGQLQEITAQLQEMTELCDSIDTELRLIREDTYTNLKYLQYQPEIYKTSALLLGTVIVYILFRFIISFLSRIFSDRTNY